MKKIVLMVVMCMLVLGSNKVMAAVFEDNFDSYDTSGAPLNISEAGAAKWLAPDAAPTGPGYHQIMVGGWLGGKTEIANSYWGENADLTAYAKLPSAMADCTVSADAFKFPGYAESAGYYIVARATETSFVKLTVVDGGYIDGDEENPRCIYARLTDSDGGNSGDLYIGAWTQDSAISMTLTLNGSDVTASIINGSSSLNIAGTTTVLEAGTAGFGSASQWNYAIALFDNFVVTPEPTTMLILGLGMAFMRSRK